MISPYSESIQAMPIRIIPFDLGRSLNNVDIQKLEQYINSNFQIKNVNPKEKSILKDCVFIYNINELTVAHVYKNGITVVVINEVPIDLSSCFQTFSITYGENRKQAHSRLFRWEHPCSFAISHAINDMRKIVKENARGSSIRRSASIDFENSGMSYVMTLSMFDVSCGTAGYKEYPGWLKCNISALLDPSLVYLEDSSIYETAVETGFNLEKLIKEIALEEPPKDYERHRHIDTYMSWAAVIVIGQLQNSDKEEYTALEVQLQCDWFYVYCIEKSLTSEAKPTKQEIINYQRQNYELDLLENRLYDFDDSSIPARVLDIQKGLVATSGLSDNISHTQRKIRYILEREQLNSELRQKKLGQSTELLLFIIAFIEIAPTVAEYGEVLFHRAGTILNSIILILGLVLTLRKDR